MPHSSLKSKLDDFGRTLVPITVFSPFTDESTNLDAWIDTGFTGFLSLRPTDVASLALPLAGDSPITLADGSQRVIASHRCRVQWFDTLRDVRALVAPTRYPLIGVHLLAYLMLSINFDSGDIELAPTENFFKNS